MSVYVAYLLVHCLAILSCSGLLVVYWVAMLPTRGSAVRGGEHAELYIDRASTIALICQYICTHGIPHMTMFALQSSH